MFERRRLKHIQFERFARCCRRVSFYLEQLFLVGLACLRLGNLCEFPSIWQMIDKPQTVVGIGFIAVTRSIGFRWNRILSNHMHRRKKKPGENDCAKQGHVPSAEQCTVCSTESRLALRDS